MYTPTKRFYFERLPSSQSNYCVSLPRRQRVKSIHNERYVLAHIFTELPGSSDESHSVAKWRRMHEAPDINADVTIDSHSGTHTVNLVTSFTPTFQRHGNAVATNRLLIAQSLVSLSDHRISAFKFAPNEHVPSHTTHTRPNNHGSRTSLRPSSPIILYAIESISPLTADVHGDSVIGLISGRAKSDSD